MQKSSLKRAELNRVVKGSAGGFFIKVELTAFTGDEDRGTKFPDIEIVVKLFGSQVFAYRFVL